MQLRKEGIKLMGIFDRKKTNATADLMAMIDDPAEPETLDQNAVLGYLTELNDEEYKKLIAVAVVYRAADKKANEIMEKVTDGEKIEVRVIPGTPGTSELSFEQTDTQVTKKTKGTAENANKTK